jgi:Rrf2 family nitric oxide-sensitive transcriptional repressor
MRLNKSTSHAIRILIECARAGDRLVKVADLAAALDLTTQNVFKIVHLLSRAGLVAATRGRNGGVKLARAAKLIRMGDIVRAMEATDFEIDLEGPLSGASGRAVKGVNRVLDDALEAFVSVLDQHTLADMTAGKATSAKLAVAPPVARELPRARSAPAKPRSRSMARTTGN